MSKALFAYKQAVVSNFLFLKSAESIQEAYLRAIPVHGKGFLVPVCKAHKEDLELLEKITNWRNTNVEAHSTQFVANLESTKSWLVNQLLEISDRILFLVTNIQGNVIGHIGFSGCLNDYFLFEIDNVIRGRTECEKGIFSGSLKTLMEWARKTLNVDGFCLRVMDDNLHAIAFFERNGFIEERRIPLVKHEINDQIRFQEARNGGVKAKGLVCMSYKPNREPGKAMILTAGPSISAREAVYAYDAALNGWNTNWSNYLTAFEKQFASYVGVKYAIATSSCTGALQIALMALEIGPGDEVIVPDLTWVATANAVRYVGAVPVFADVELDTWNLDANSFETLITSRTKAVIAVHMYGHPSRMNLIFDIAKKYGLKVVEDAAPAIGAEWQGQRCGSFGDFAAFSFQGAKLLVTGEGGMLVTNDSSLYQKALKIWDQGRNPLRVFWIDADGVKYKMSNVQASIGLAQLERADELIEMKRRIFDWYEEGLNNTPFITLNKEVEDARSIYWMSSLLLDEASPISRDELIKALKQRNVDTRPVFPAISQYPIWQSAHVPQPIALRIGERAINLPSGVCLSKDDVMYVSKQIRELIRVC